MLSFLALMSFVVSLQSAPSAAEVLHGLDLTSFRNSTGPRREVGLRRPVDWAFSGLSIAGGQASLERPKDGWTISLEILRTTSDGVIACFNDQARNGGSYSAQTALHIVRDDVGGYRVVDETVRDPDCPPRLGQG